MLPFDDFEFAFPGFHQRGQTFHPVTVVAVDNSINGLDLRFMDVAADDAMEAAISRFPRDSPS